MQFLASLASGLEGASIWDRIWSGDPYADRSVRDRRAWRRLASFELLNSFAAGARLLDAGCGSGDTLDALSRAHDDGPELVGIDFSQRAVSLADVRLAGRANVLQADVTNLPFPDGHFTHVLLFGIIEHVRDEAKALAEIYRVSQPGAMIYLSTSNYFSALQGANFIRRNTCGYPYGYQKNWKRRALEERLREFFLIRSLRYAHADLDMPLIQIFDKAAAHVFPAWARYIHVTCEMHA